MTVVFVLSVWVVLFALNLLLTWSRSAHELEAAVAVVTAAGLFCGAAHGVRARDLLVRPRPKVLLAPWPRFLSESWWVGRVLCGVLLRPRRAEPVGTVAVQPFREGGENRDDAGRRAAVVLSGSVTPNGFALHLPGGGDRIVLHRLAPQPADADREWPT